jgi:hypothetical protein
VTVICSFETPPCTCRKFAANAKGRVTVVRIAAKELQ